MAEEHMIRVGPMSEVAPSGEISVRLEVLDDDHVVMSMNGQSTILAVPSGHPAILRVGADPAPGVEAPEIAFYAVTFFRPSKWELRIIDIQTYDKMDAEIRVSTGGCGKCPNCMES